MRTNCGDFINQVFNRNNTMLSKNFFNKTVVGKGDSLLIDLSIASLVDKSFDGFTRRISKLYEIYPKVMYGSTLLKRLVVALLTLTKAPLWSCLSLKSLRILTVRGLSLLTPLILTTKATLGAAGTWICPLALAALRAAISYLWDLE